MFLINCCITSFADSHNWQRNNIMVFPWKWLLPGYLATGIKYLLLSGAYTKAFVHFMSLHGAVPFMHENGIIQLQISGF